MKISKCINNHIVEILIAFALALCIWAVGCIQLKIIPFIPISLPKEVCDNWNALYVNLAYSFIAGFIFYLLTTTLRAYNERRKLRKVLQNKVKQIATPIDAVIEVFYGCVGAKLNRSRKGITDILMSRNMRDIVEIAAELGYNLDSRGSYINFLANKCQISKDRVFEMIKLYVEYLTAEEIILLESYASMPIINRSSLISGINVINPDDEKIKKIVIDQFCDLYDKLNEIRKIFK